MYLPAEILLKIFGFLHREDLFAVHTACKKFKSLLDPVLHSIIYAQWSDLAPLCTSFSHLTQFMCELRIYTPDSGAEWKSSGQLADVAACSPNLETLSVVCMGSSGWLKYVGVLPIKTLKLKSLGQSQVKIFDFEHLGSSFPVLESLELAEYALLPAPDPLPRLSSLSLFNCTWEYPMQLANIGDIKFLTIIIYGNLHPFAFSERLMHDTSHLPPNLEYLKVHLTIAHQVNWRPLHIAAPKLQKLDLAGFCGFKLSREMFPLLDDINSSSVVVTC